MMRRSTVKVAVSGGSTGECVCVCVCVCVSEILPIGHFVCKLTSEMRTTSLQGTVELSQCVHYSEVPLY